MNDSIQTQRGFTLIELMVTIAIFGILTSIAVGAWNTLRESNKVEAAAESGRSVLMAARMRAMSTGKPQQVTVNFVANGGVAADTIASTLRNGGALVGNVVRGNERGFDVGVDFLNGTKSGGVCVLGATDAFKTIQFNSRGSAQTLPAGKTRTILVRDGQGANQFCLEINNVTGRVLLTKM